MQETILITRKKYNIKPVMLVMVSLFLISIVCKMILNGIGYITLGFLPGMLFLVIVLGIVSILNSSEVNVTDKRVYGKTAFGRRVDLPLDSITAISRTRFLKGLAVASSSGIIRFRMIKNINEIYEVIGNLLVQRQTTRNNTNDSNNTSDIPDQIKKYKELLDSGIITKEEFEAKKKDLLGL